MIPKAFGISLPFPNTFSFFPQLLQAQLTEENYQQVLDLIPFQSIRQW